MFSNSSSFHLEPICYSGCSTAYLLHTASAAPSCMPFWGTTGGFLHLDKFHDIVTRGIILKEMKRAREARGGGQTDSGFAAASWPGTGWPRVAINFSSSPLARADRSAADGRALSSFFIFFSLLRRFFPSFEHGLGGGVSRLRSLFMSIISIPHLLPGADPAPRARESKVAAFKVGITERSRTGAGGRERQRSPWCSGCGVRVRGLHYQSH